MVFKIVWTLTALESYVQIMDHLEKMWSEKEAANFARRVEKRIATLSKQPYIGIKQNSKQVSVRSIVLHKRVLLAYKKRD